MSHKSSQQLRENAEEIITGMMPTVAPGSSNEKKLLHELDVYQIELEMQNDELRRTQIILEETRDRFIDLYELAPIGYLTLTHDAIISEINLTAAAMLGIEHKRHLNLRFLRFIAPEDHNQWHRHFLETLKKDATYDCELKLLRLDGSSFYGGLSCKCADGNVVYITLADITKRKEAETQLRESKERLHAILDGALDGILLVNVDTKKFDTCNQAFCKMLGYSIEEVSLLGVMDIHPLQDLPDILDKFERHVSGETQYSTDLSVMRKDGSVLNVDIRSSPVHIGNQVYLVAIFRDITERRKVEAELREQQQLLREMSTQNLELRENERKHIAKEVHDELGQILTALRMKVSLLRIRFGGKSPELGKNIKEMLVMVDEAIQGVRNVAHSLRPSVLDFGVIPAIEWLCDNFHDRSNAACTMHVADGDVDLDEMRTLAIFRIVQESLTNVARHAEADSVKITVDKSGDDVLVEVRDDGKGFDHVYVPSRNSFGLMGMYERAHAMDGSVEISSAPAKGTVVRIRIPIKPKENIK